LIGYEMQCCWPEQFGGCRAPPQMRGPLPPNYLPPPQFLHNVCCKQSDECCAVDEMDWNPRFKCCDDTEECVMASKKGTCTKKAANAGTTPMVPHLESTGQCPVDGSLALEVRPGEPFRCTFNSRVNGYKCPSDSHCVRDNTGNVNSGVCCRDTTSNSTGTVKVIGCNKYTDCFNCVKNDDKDVKAQCGWLTLGSLDNQMPRCVINCDNFPQKSCILPSDGRFCPADASMGVNNTNGTIVNTGTCDRRCGYIGTGRAVGINNNGNRIPVAANASAIKKDSCCMDHPGDYCCDFWNQIAGHCTAGRAPGGPLCGVPMRGTPNALYVPQWEPLGPYQNAPFGSGPTPYGNFPPYGQQFGYGPQHPGLPYGPGYGRGPMPFGYGPGPMQGQFGAGPTMYGQFYGPYRSGEIVKEEETKEETIERYMMFPSPMYYPQRPPPMPRPVPSIVAINPSPFVCSCDADCKDYEDCCADITAECVF